MSGRKPDRPKKRRFRGNQYFFNPVNPPKNIRSQAVEETRLADPSSSKRKISRSPSRETTTDWSGYRILDIDLFLASLIVCIGCKSCGGKVEIREVQTSGLYSKFEIDCLNCGCIGLADSSPILERTSEINKRSVLLSKQLGLGLTGLQKIAGMLDLPVPPKHTAYNRILRDILPAVNNCAQVSMKAAAKLEAEETKSSDIAVSGDGTWQKRGHTSKNGVCTVIGVKSGKVIDAEVLSNYCKGCASFKGNIEMPEFQEWEEKHQCQQNHQGSAGKMEVEGMKRIFQRSVEDRGVKYVKYIGDGDAKTYQAVVDSKPYPDADIVKIECVGHVQKRMGTHLRRIKLEYRGKKLADGKTIGGKGRLTDALIDRMTQYYGNAIRNNTNNAEDMYKAIWAIFYHYSSTDAKPSHKFCPTGESSWCKYNKAEAQNLKNFKHKSSVPRAIMDLIKKAFTTLSSPELLRRCIGGYTQNPNESLNSSIWNLCPKTKFFGRSTVQMAVDMAILQFNDGYKSLQTVLDACGIRVGPSMNKWIQDEDNKRIYHADRKAALETKEARKARRQAAKEDQEKTQEAEGEMYGAGAF